MIIPAFTGHWAMSVVCSIGERGWDT